MRLLPEKKIKIVGLRDELLIDYDEITQYDILRYLTSKLMVSDYKAIQVDTSSKDGKIILTVSKDKLIEILTDAESFKQEEEYKEKYLLLRDRIGDAAVKYLMTTKTMVDPDELVKYLPSKELIEKDCELWYRLFELSCGYHAPDEGLLSIELSKKLALGKTLDEYPDQLEYHYYYYPQQFKSLIPATFTKTEFMEDIKEQEKNS